MTVDIQYTQKPDCPLSGQIATINVKEGLTFCDVVTVVRAEYRALTLACIDARTRGDCDAQLVETIKKRSALGFALTELADSVFKQEHAASVFKHLTCCADWCDLFAIDTASDDGQIPRPGQQGAFWITVGLWTYQVTYSPEKFGCTDHLTFRHWRDGKTISDPCPLTETGFKSHFISTEIIDDFGDVEAVARGYIEANSTVPEHQCLQGSLF